MFSLNIVILAAAAGAVIGLLIGKALGQGGHQRTLEEQLDETKKQLRDYQDNVAEHFHETSTLVKQMAENHIRLSQHLVNGANQLANIDIAPELGIQKAIEDKIEQPKDWAPQSGVLREDYRLADDLDLAATTASGKQRDSEHAIDAETHSK